MKNDELASLGIRAYQAGDYSLSVEFLHILLTNEPTLWTCRLYLAMAYERAGDISHAVSELETLASFATDQSVRKKAVEALRVLHSRHSPLAH